MLRLFYLFILSKSDPALLGHNDLPHSFPGISYGIETVMRSDFRMSRRTTATVMLYLASSISLITGKPQREP